MLKSFKNSIQRFFVKSGRLFSNPEFVVGFVKQHLFYLLWILIVPVTLYVMAQGRELFTGLFDDHTFFTAIRGGGLLTVYFLQAMAVFLLPTPFYRRHKVDDWHHMRPTTLNNPGVVYALSVLPTLLYGVVMIVVQADKIPFWGWPLIALTLTGTILAGYWFEDKWPFHLRGTLLIVLGNMLLCILTLHLIPETANRFWNYFAVGGFLMIQMALLGGLTRKLHHAFVQDHRHPVLQSTASGTRRKLSLYDALYLFVFMVLTGFVVLCIAASNVEGFSPIFMLLMTTTFYMLMSSLTTAFYRYNIQGKTRENGYPKWRFWTFWGFAAVCLAVLMRLGAPIHDVKTVASPLSPGRRADFNTWFETWSKANLLPDTAGRGEIPVYLLAIQGGGSRAGLWSAALMNELERRSGYRFHSHCLAVSSASGGSAGVGAALSLWRFAADSSAFMARLGARRDSLYSGFAAGVFQRNYLSSSFYELMVGEVGTSFLYFSKMKQDRNYRQQKDEALGFAAGLRNGIFDGQHSQTNLVAARFRALWHKGEAGRLPLRGDMTVHNYPFDPYLSYWYTPDGAIKPNLPLYFPISTNIQTGRSAFSSPVKMESCLFPDAIDLLSCVDTCWGKPGHTLSMVGATNLSQLFPVMNAFTFVPGAGNFVDGGLFENMGLNVMLEIYKRTDSLVQNTPWLQPFKDRIKIHFVIATNNALEPKSSSFQKTKIPRTWQPGALLSFTSRASINGMTTYFMKKTTLEIKPSTQLHEFWLQSPDTLKHDIPLGRWLAKRTIRVVQTRIGQYEYELNALTRPLVKK